MRIEIERTGGAFTTARRVDIDDDVMHVLDHPPDRGMSAARRTAKLARTDVAELTRLAAPVARGGDQTDPESGGVDGGRTVVTVDDGNARSRVEIGRGRQTRPEVWDLLDAVDGLTEKHAHREP